MIQLLATLRANLLTACGLLLALAAAIQPAAAQWHDGAGMLNEELSVAARINDAPGFAPELTIIQGIPASFSAGSIPMPINLSLEVYDSDSEFLKGALVRFAGDYEQGKDYLVFHNQNGISGEFDSSAGTLILSGEADLLSYRNALRWVMYFRSGSTDGGGERVVEFQVDDGLLDSNTVAQRIVLDIDSDGDGTGDSLDPDDDNDLLSDIEELAYGSDPLSPDTDGDGVKDGVEAADGSDLLDAGSSLQRLSRTTCVEWNGFLDMRNILELVSHAPGPRTLWVDMHDMSGGKSSTTTLSLMPKMQRDVLVHTLPGFQRSSYGQICTRNPGGADGELDGRTVFYYSAPAEPEQIRFAFATPLTNPVKGRQFVHFNTYQPSLAPEDAENPVSNWVQLINRNPVKAAGELVLHGMDGRELARHTVELAPWSRSDIAAHAVGAGRVGYAAWVPDKPEQAFILRNARYVFDNAAGRESFTSAFQLSGRKGTGSRLSAVLDAGIGSAILEISNVLEAPNTVSVQIFNDRQQQVYAETHSLDAGQSMHVIADSLLEGGRGLAIVQGGERGSLIATAMQYGRAERGRLTFLYGTPAREPLGTKLRGSYNTYLNQSCELQLGNAGAEEVEVALSMTRNDGTEVLSERILRVPARGVLAYDLCAQDQADVYGQILLHPKKKNSITAAVVRIGEGGSYRFPTPVRQ